MYKKIFYIILLFSRVSMLNADNSQQDILRAFLEYLGEDSVSISMILKSPNAENPSQTIEEYLMFNTRLIYDSEKQTIEVHHGWDDSTFVCNCALYLQQLIISDTTLRLIYPCLFEAFLINHMNYSGPILLDCAEKAINAFHSREAILIPELYYYNHREINTWQERRQFYEMVKVILMPLKYVYTFDDMINMKFNSILAEPDSPSSYYAQFRSFVDGYTDLELARINKDQEKEIVNILLQGIAHGEKKSQLTYAFMLITGQFVEQDEELGKEILFKILLD